MPSKFRLRYVFKPLIKVLAKGLNKIGLSPNMATILMLINSIVSILFLIILENLLLFSIFVFLTGIFDGIDGAIARLENKSSAFGGYFDSVMDRFSEFVILFGLLIYFRDFILWNIIDMKLIILITLLGSIMISYSRARVEVLYKGDFDIGLMARSERLFYIFLTMIISHFWDYEEFFIFLFMIFVLLTAFFRFFKIRNIINKHNFK
ncbi:MAG: hypothetical protein GF317_02530 [Candidatus Lokiarchaeota archaeon]|nr:hypothetical protein [Candidatus Lokiarchaeota archaeon]MBD3198782.1 hypothetical protein [Candidatus Lokiarchaeota archaeon]